MDSSVRISIMVHAYTHSFISTHTFYVTSEMTCLIWNHWVKEGTIYLRFMAFEM